MFMIGSRSLQLRAPLCLTRAPLDFDLVGTQQEYEQWFKANEEKIKPAEVYPEAQNTKWIIKGQGNTIVEFDIIQPGSSNELLADLVENGKDTLRTSFGSIPSADLLFTIKDTHKYKKFHLSNKSFWKHTLDWHQMKRAGCKIREEYKEFHSLREKETYNYSHPNLNQTKNMFFSNDGLTLIVDHDDIHQSIKYLDKPAYQYYLKQNSEVMTDKNKFFACPREIQLYGVSEEAATLSIERALLPPHPNKMGPKQAWLFGLSKVSTSITSGFFRKFAFENIFDIIKIYPENYWEKFQKDLAEGRVRYLNKEDKNDNI